MSFKASCRVSLRLYLRSHDRRLFIKVSFWFSLEFQLYKVSFRFHVGFLIKMLNSNGFYLGPGLFRVIFRVSFRLHVGFLIEISYQDFKR